MNTTASPVVVGIDGSPEAIYAARWAAEEATSHDAPLRLLYVVRTDLSQHLQANDYRTEVDAAKSALHAARDAVEADGRPIMVETDIAEGNPAGVLIAESANAGLICVGSAGIGRAGQAFLGSTAAAVAQKARCSSAIVLRRKVEDLSATETRWIVIPVSDTTTSHDAVLSAAVDEARLRGCAILAVGVRGQGTRAPSEQALVDWVTQRRIRFPGVAMYPVASSNTLARYLKRHPEIAHIVVVDNSYTDDLRTLLGIHHQSHADEHGLAVLIVAEQS